MKLALTAKAGSRSAGSRSEYGEAERAARVELAACYRLVALHGMSDLVATHVSSRVPGEDGVMLLNPFGMFFEEITASDLIKVNHAGDILSETNYPVNKAAIVIHGAVHAARPEVGCVIHTHTRAGMAVSAMKCGLLPLTQHALRFHNRIGYHDYEGIAVEDDEGPRLVADLGTHKAMILRNHGLLTAGRTVAEAFNLVYYLEKSCQSQVDAMTSGAELVMPSEEVCESTARQIDHFRERDLRDLDWPAHLRTLDRLDPGYKD